MRPAAQDEGVLSREELDALLAEMPRVLSEREEERSVAGARFPDLEVQRANHEFAFAQGLTLSNRYQRVIHLALIGHREVESRELAELMLPTDLVASFQIGPKGHEGYLLLSRPFFFELLGMSFGAGPTVKATRPPTREYTRIERRFYERAAREVLGQLERAWGRVAPVETSWKRLVDRSSVAQADREPAVIASFDVRGLSEACRIRVVIPIAPFERGESAPARRGPGTAVGAASASLLGVPIEVRARVGRASITLGQLGRLAPGQVLELDADGEGELEIEIGGRPRFRGIAGSRGSRRAVQLTESIGSAE